MNKFTEIEICNRRLAACELHISERTLYRKIKETD